MLSKELVENLKARYNVHPLIFSRSVSRARSDTDLFDILDSIPDSFPIVWSDDDHRWCRPEDLYLSGDFVF